MAEEYFIAVSSTDGKMINEHFGHSDAFEIFRVQDNESYTHTERREVNRACSNCGNHDDTSTLETIKALFDCKYVLCSKIGPGSWRALENSGIHPLEITHFIDYAIEKVMLYDKKFMRRRNF